MEERRLLLAVALSFLVLIAYRMLFTPVPQPQPSAPSAPTATPEAVQGGTPQAPATPVTAAAPTAPRTQAPAEAAAGGEAPRYAPVAAEFEQRVEVQGAQAIVAFSNRGARLVSWRLQRYRDARGQPEEMLRLTSEGARALDLETGEPELDARLREALFRSSGSTLVLQGDAAGELRFEYAEAGLRAEKTLVFRDGGLLLAVTARVERAGQELPVRVLWGPGLGNPTPEEREVQGYKAPEVVYLAEGAVTRVPAARVDGHAVPGRAGWIGVESHHFAALWIPPDGLDATLSVLPVPTTGQEKEELPVVSVAVPARQGPVLLYVGPKDYDQLARLGHQLQRVVPVGDWIGPLVVPLMRLLRWVHGFIGNYGWSIVVLTVLINLAMAPLRHYSIANSMKMAKLSPEMKVIQERYRKVPALDPRRQEMQRELSELYARHGMNMSTQMLVGCLPLLLTMPFLIAFYRVLMVSIDLRGASFLWIPDLSHKDPLFVTPILMGVSMLAMQRMMPSTMDAAQQRMMMIMPLVLVVMFFAAPAGLNLYWLASNGCSIVQQGVTLRLLREPEKAPARREKKGRSGS